MAPQRQRSFSLGDAFLMLTSRQSQSDPSIRQSNSLGSISEPKEDKTSLEEQLVDVKIELASSKEREDYLRFQLKKIEEFTKHLVEENKNLKEKLKKQQNRESQQHVNDVEKIKSSHPPLFVGLEYLNKNNAVSCLTFDGVDDHTDVDVSAREFGCGEGEIKEDSVHLAPGEYLEPLRGGMRGKRGKVGIARPPSCASGLAFMFSENLSASTS